MRSIAAGVMVAVLSSVIPASGQPPAKPNVSQQRMAEAQAALQKAIDDSKSATKVLLVMFSGDAGRLKANDQTLAVPATAAWIARHGTAHTITDQRLISALGEVKFFKPGVDGQPGEVDPNRRLTQIAGGDPLFYTDGLIELLDKQGSIILPNTPKADPKTPTGQGSLAMAMRLDWTLRSPIASEDYRKRHYAALPPVAWPGSAPDKHPKFLAALADARALARDKKWDAAANAYANVWWDAGGNIAAAPVRVGEMAAEMALIAQQTPGAKDRLLSLRTEYARAMDVSDPRHVHEYLILCRVLGDHEHNLKFLDEATQSKASASLLPPADVTAYDWMLPRCHWNDPNEGVSKPGAWITQVLRQCDKFAARKDGPPMTSAVDYGRWLARVEAARRVTALLIAGKDDKAIEVRDAATAADPSPEMKRAIVTCAVASAQKRPWMADLLKGVTPLDEELAAELAK